MDKPEPVRTSRSTSATLSPTILRYLVLVAAARGVDLQPAMLAAGLEPDLLQSPELRVSYRQGAEVIRRAVQLTGDGALGLAVGSAQHVTSWGLTGFALLCSETLHDAVTLGVRYENMLGAMVISSVEPEGGGFALVLDLPDQVLDPAVRVFMLDEAFSSVLTVAREAVGESFAPERVEFASPPPPHAAKYDEVFRCPVHFGAARNRCVFSRRWAHRPLPAREPWTWAVLVAMLDEGVTQRKHQQDLLEGLEVSIARSLPEVPSFEEQARRNASSERTFRRRLAECGTSYNAIVDGVRRERAEKLLMHSQLTVREVGRQVGFADERALRRAVQRWHGISPSTLRRELTEGARVLS